MATLRSYSATFEQDDLAQAAIARYRFNEGSGTDALDSVDDLDGSYEAGAAPGAAGSIGDGAATFDGSTGFVLVETLSGAVTVSAFGDSLIGGVGFQDPEDRFSPVLEAALDARGLDADVINRGVNGDTSADGLARIQDVIDDNPDVVILELGTNDAIQERDLTDVEQDLRDIISDLRAENIQVLVTGTFGWYPERNGGVGYDNAADRDALEALFADIVSDLGDPGVVLLQDTEGSDKFLGGERDPGDPGDLDDDAIVGGVLADGDPNNLNSDGLHPNAAGIDVIVPRIAPQTIALGNAAGAVNEPLLLANGTFEVWFTADVVSATRNLFAKNSEGPGTGGQVAMAVRNGEMLAAIGSASTNFSVEGGTVAVGELTQAVLTFGAAGMELYVNGELVDTNDHTGGLDTGLGNFEPLVIGAESGFSTPGTIDDLQQFFQGTIDEFAVYDRALSADEIQQLFEGGEFGSTVIGTAGADELFGGSDAEELRGAGGNDTIEGNGGDDELRGGAGADEVRGGAGDDELYGGSGNDELRGGAGNDALDGKDGGDALLGGEGDDLLQGGAGADLLSGAGGNDELVGNKGIDELDGGAGDDLLNGGNGKDLLTGGAGSDTFQIDSISHGVDQIFDFEDGEEGDVLDLSAVLDFGGGDDVDDFVRLTEVGANAKVEVDANGGGDSFTAVFNLLGAGGLDIGNLVDDGNVQLTSTPS